MKKPKQSTKPATRDELTRPVLKLTVPASHKSAPASAQPRAARSGAPAGTTTTKPFEFRLFDPDAPVGTQQTVGGSITIPSTKLKPNIHQEPGSADRKIDVTPDQFPLKRYDPLRKVLQTEKSILHVANDLLVGTAVLVHTGRSALSDEEKTNFVSQVASAKRLQHNNALAILDGGITSGGNAFVVSEYVTGMTFKKYLEENGPVDDLVLINIFLEVCNTVCAVQSQGVVLNDLTLDGIILAASIFGTTTVKISTFGVEFIKPRSEQSGETDAPTTAPPEEAKLEVANPQRKDVDAFGRCLCEAFKINSQTHRKRSSGGPVQMTGLWLKEGKAEEQQNEEIEKFLNRADSKNPGEWFDSILTIKHELQAMQELLTYSNGGPRANQAQKAFDKKAIKSFMVILPLLFLLSAVLILSMRPLPMAEMNPGDLTQRKSYLADTLFFPMFLSGRNGLENIQVNGPDLIIEGSDLTYSKLQTVLTSHRRAFAQKSAVYSLSSPVVDETGDVFSQSDPPLTVDEYGDRLMPTQEDQSITSITLRNCRIETNALDALARENRLRTITFDNCAGLTPAAMERLTMYPHQVESMIFQATDARGQSLYKLKNLRFMRSLEILDSKLDDADLRYIAQIPVRVLTLSNTQVTIEGLKIFAKSDTLTRLNLYRNKNITKTRVQVQEKFPNLVIGFDEYY